MKKLSVTILLVTVCLFTAKAQLYLGFKGGVNIGSVINYDNVKIPEVWENLITGTGDNSYRVGFNAGLMLNYTFARGILAIQPEVLFSNQGTKSSGTIAGIDGTSYEANIKTNYINIPFMFQIYFLPKILCIEIGPQVGFLVYAKAHSSVTAAGLTYESDWDIKDQLNIVDFSLAGGLGFQIPNFPLGFNARYTIGFTNVNKDDNGRNLNSVFQIGAVLRFGTKKAY